MQFDALYQEIILDHYKRPHGRGLREPFQGEAHHVNPTCGDEIDIRVHLDGATIDDVVAGRGAGEPDEELLEDGVAFAGVAKYPARVKCALLPWMAFKDALVRAQAASASTDGDERSAQTTTVGGTA